MPVALVRTFAVVTVAAELPLRGGDAAGVEVAPREEEGQRLSMGGTEPGRRTGDAADVDAGAWRKFAAGMGLLAPMGSCGADARMGAANVGWPPHVGDGGHGADAYSSASPASLCLLKQFLHHLQRREIHRAGGVGHRCVVQATSWELSGSPGLTDWVLVVGGHQRMALRETPLACGPGSPELSKSYMDMASKLFTFTFTCIAMTAKAKQEQAGTCK